MQWGDAFDMIISAIPELTACFGMSGSVRKTHILDSCGYKAGATSRLHSTTGIVVH